MSNEALNYVFRIHPSRIKGIPRFVLTVLADFADEQHTCWPSIETLCRRTSWSERSVRDSLRTLEQMGVLITERRRRLTARYLLNLALDLTQPLRAAPHAGLKKTIRKGSEVSRQIHERIEDGSREDLRPAPCAPLDEAASGVVRPAGNAVLDRQEMSSRPAPCAPKPLENPYRTLKGGGARMRATPLPTDWEPSASGVAYAASLGLDPAQRAQRFRLHFRHTGAVSADWQARWLSWCLEDAEKGRATNPAPSQAGTALTTATEQVPDADGLDHAGRTWVQNWDRKRAAGLPTETLEAMMRRDCPAALKAVERRKAEAAGLGQAAASQRRLDMSLSRQYF